MSKKSRPYRASSRRRHRCRLALIARKLFFKRLTDSLMTVYEKAFGVSYCPRKSPWADYVDSLSY